MQRHQLSFFLLLVMLSCTDRVPRSLGPLREVTVITDYWPVVAKSVEGILSQEIRTPQPEPEFRLRVGGFDRFSSLCRLRLVFLIGTSQDTLLRRILGTKLDSLPENNFGLFKFPNAWVDNQWVLVFVAADTAYLIPGLSLYARRIHQTVTEMVIDQTNRATYLWGLEKDLTAKLRKQFSWSIDVPRGWQLQDKDSVERFVYIFTHYPDRSIFVYWEDSTMVLDWEAMLNLHDRLTGQFYDGDSADRSMVLLDTIQFLGVPALRVRGVWQNRREILGGPFVFYAFNYQGRFFMVDGLVFNPGEKKLSNLFQVEAIIRTFLPMGIEILNGILINSIGAVGFSSPHENRTDDGDVVFKNP
ncbi:MAG: DUF4837 family protein [bacterium]